jgi:hypothetical protein
MPTFAGMTDRPIVGTTRRFVYVSVNPLRRALVTACSHRRDSARLGEAPGVV